MVDDDTWHVGEAASGSHRRPGPSSQTRTSITDPLPIATIPVGEKGGRIGITFCPGKKGPSVFGAPWDRDLTADVTVIQEWGASAVLTLIEPHEFSLLNVDGLPEALKKVGIVWHHAPIPDVSVPGPAFEMAWRTIEPMVLNDLREGRSIVVHCRGGRGRAGMIAARLLTTMGEDAVTAIERVRSVQPEAIETSEQEAYVRGQGAPNVWDRS